MQLHRVTVDAFDNYPVGGKYLGQSVDYLEIRPTAIARRSLHFDSVACFNRFGAGAHRKSDYEVLSDWQDIEAIIAKFCEAGHPAAIELDRARQLAKAVKAAGWTEPKS
jgi:hypothetical protein